MTNFSQKRQTTKHKISKKTSCRPVRAPWCWCIHQWFAHDLGPWHVLTSPYLHMCSLVSYLRQTVSTFQTKLRFPMRMFVKREQHGTTQINWKCWKRSCSNSWDEMGDEMKSHMLGCILSTSSHISARFLKYSGCTPSRNLPCIPHRCDHQR